MKKILFYLTMPFRSSYWIMNYKYDKQWDLKFQSLIDKHDFNIIDRYEAFLGDEKVWITNVPYSVFVKKLKITASIEICLRPSRWTIYRGMQKLNKTYKQLESDARKGI